MKAMKRDNAVSNTRSARGGSDPRDAVGMPEKGETIRKFSSDPFKDGGAQEQRDVSAGKMNVPKGPTIKKAPKEDRVEDAVSDRSIKGDYAD